MTTIDPKLTNPIKPGIKTSIKSGAQTKNTPVSKILISSSDIILEKDQPVKGRLANIKENQVVQGKVIKVVNPRLAQIEIMGEKVFAKLNVPLNKGENILLKVTKEGLQPTFKLLSSESAGISQINNGLLKSLGKEGPYKTLQDLMTFIKNNRGDSKLLKNKISKMEDIIQKASVKSSEPNHENLKSWVKNSGLTYENKLMTEIKSNPNLLTQNMEKISEQDLKALSMELIALLGDDDSDISGMAKSFVNNLEQMQLLNAQASEDSGKLLLPLPVLGNEMFKFGQMLIDLGNDEKTDKNSDDRLIKVAFLLEMSNFGNIRADFSILKKSIIGAFGVETEEERDLFEDNIPFLVNSLNSQGFQIHKIDCHVMGSDKLKNSSLTDEIVNDDKKVLNIIV